MTKWVAKINENDDEFGEEILLGIEGGENGFEVILSSGDLSDALPGYTEDEAMENLDACYGFYETFDWL